MNPRLKRAEKAMAQLQPVPVQRWEMFCTDELRPGIVWRDGSREEVVPAEELAAIEADPNVSIVFMRSVAPRIWLSRAAGGFRVDLVQGGTAPVQEGDIITAERAASLEAAHYKVEYKK